MGLLKPELAGGAQAVQHADVGYELAGAWTAGFAQGGFAGGLGGAFHDAAVTNDVEDAEVDDILRRQEKEVFEGTLRLQALEAVFVAKAGKATGPVSGSGAISGSGSARPGSPPSVAEEVAAAAFKAQRGGPALKLSSSSGARAAPALPPPPSDPVQLPFEKLLKLLLASLKGSFAASIPRQKCASPVPYNASTTGYHPMFYVSKERKLSKHDDTFAGGIPVRYQGFTKSTIWYSPENPRWGIVARKMQHQSRMKQKGSGVDQNMACKASLFFQVFEGFSYVLIERSSPDEEVNKANLANYVVENAAKFVQVWPLSKQVWPLSKPPSGSHGAVGRALAPSAAPGVQVKLEQLPPPPQAQRQQQLLHAQRQYQQQQQQSRSKRALDEAEDSHVRESKRQHSSEELEQWLGNFEADEQAGASELDFSAVAAGAEDLGSVHSASTHSSSSSSSRSSSSSSNHDPDRLQRNASSSSSSSSSFAAAATAFTYEHTRVATRPQWGSHAAPHAAHSRHDLLLLSPDADECALDTLLGSALLGSALLAQEDDFSSYRSDDTTLQDIFVDESDDGFGGSHDPFGVVLCDSIFKRFCDSMEGSQFAREYDRVQSLLFNKQFNQSLRVAVDNKDPRITQEFMFPDQGSPAAQFVAGKPVGTVHMTERELGSSDFVVDTCDAPGKELLAFNPEGSANVFEQMDKSDMAYIMAKFYWLQNKSSNYWFQRVLTLGDGRLVVMRGFVVVGGCQTTGKQTMTVRFQDVSPKFPEILQLPATDLI